jgi:predicted small lipoprotein YifL
MRNVIALMLLVGAMALTGCAEKKKPAATPPANPAPPVEKPADTPPAK